MSHSYARSSGRKGLPSTNEGAYENRESVEWQKCRRIFKRQRKGLHMGVARTRKKTFPQETLTCGKKTSTVRDMHPLPGVSRKERTIRRPAAGYGKKGEILPASSDAEVAILRKAKLRTWEREEDLGGQGGNPRGPGFAKPPRIIEESVLESLILACTGR